MKERLPTGLEILALHVANEAVDIVDALLGQQAMPDPGLDVQIERWKHMVSQLQAATFYKK